MAVSISNVLVLYPFINKGFRNIVRKSLQSLCHKSTKIYLALKLTAPFRHIRRYDAVAQEHKKTGNMQILPVLVKMQKSIYFIPLFLS
jgi:hypothetical protein